VRHAPALPSTAAVDQRGEWHRRKVLLVGDSLMFQAFDAMTYLLAPHGVEVRYVGFSGTGLLSGQGWWLRDITRTVDAFRPDVVVVEACCNYGDLGPLYRDAHGHAVAPDSEAMYLHWAANARSAAERAGARGAKVFWVVTPDAGYLVTRNIQTRIHRFNAISARLGVARIDWRAALEPAGTFTTSMRTPWGIAVVRKDDTLHLTSDGNAVVAEATVAAIRPALR